MGKYIDKFISEFDKRLDDHLNLSSKKSEEFLKVRDEQIALENGVLLSDVSIVTTGSSVTGGLKKGMVGKGLDQGTANKKEYRVKTITDLKCGITEVEFKNKLQISEYGYYKPSDVLPGTTYISFRRQDEGVNVATDVCNRFDISGELVDFGTLDFSVDVSVKSVTVTPKAGKAKPFLGLGGWSGHKYKDLKGLYEYVFQKDGSMHLPPEKVKGKINPDYTFFDDWIVYRATYNVILNAKNKVFIQITSYPGKPADQDNTELFDIPEPIVERTESGGLTVGMDGEVTSVGEVSTGRKFIVKTITDLNCDITEVEFKSSANKEALSVYGYYKPSEVLPGATYISFSRKVEGVKDPEACTNFGNADYREFATLDFSVDVSVSSSKIKEFKTKSDFPFVPGDKNLKIKDIQKWLGFTGKDVDGSFGNGTYNALLYGGYLIGLTASVTSVIYDELKRDYENGVVEKKQAAAVVPPKPDPYVEFLKKAETVKEKGGGRYWFNTFMDTVEKNYIKNTTINDSIKEVMQYCDTVFGMGHVNVVSIPEIDIIGNRAVDIYYMKNYGSVGKEYDNYLKFYSVILSDNYINKDKGVLGVMSRDILPNLIPCFPEPRTIAMDTIDIDSAMVVTKRNPEDESLLLYNAFLEAAEYYSQNSDVIDTIPLSENKWEVLPSAARHLLDPKWETLGDYTFEFSMEDVVNVISGPSGPGSNILIPSYVGLTESSVNVGELFREYRGEIVSAEVLDEYKQEETEVLDEIGVTGEYDYEEDDYDELSSEYGEWEGDPSLTIAQATALETLHDGPGHNHYEAGEYKEETYDSSVTVVDNSSSNSSSNSSDSSDVVVGGSGKKTPIPAIKVMDLKGYIVNGKQKKIIDLSPLAKMKGKKIKKEKYDFFVVHHTAGLGTAEQVVNTLNQREGGLAVQFIIDRDGYIYRGTAANHTAAHVLPVQGAYCTYPKAGFVQKNPHAASLCNGNSAGCEVIACKDSDDTVWLTKKQGCNTPVIVERQGPALLKVIKHLNIPKENIFGHGETTSNKMADEGKSLKKYVLDNWDNYKLWTGDNAIAWF